MSNDRQTPEFEDVVSSLKQVLKAQKMTYRELAERVGMSESGVKKLFNGKDAAFTRLAEICGVLGVSLRDVLEVSEGRKKEPLEFTEEQEVFLEHPSCFYFLWELGHHGYDPEAVQKAHGLDDVSTRRYLEALERQGFLTIEADGSVETSLRDKTGWKMPVALGKAVIHPLQQNLLEHARVRLRAPDVYPWPELSKIAGPVRMNLRHDTAIELRQTLLETIAEFARRGRREEALYSREDLILVGAMTVMAPLESSEFVEIPEVDSDDTLHLQGQGVESSDE